MVRALRQFAPAIWKIALVLQAAGGASPAQSAARHHPEESAADSPPSIASESPNVSSAGTYAQLPMAFELNQGQSEPEVAYLARGKGYAVFLTSSEAVLSLMGGERAAAPAGIAGGRRPNHRDGKRARASRKGAVVRMQLLDASPSPAIVGLEQLPGLSHYLLGDKPAHWRTNIPQYARVVYRDVYAGIDLAYHGDQRALEYDFVLAPGADPSSIRLNFAGVEALHLDHEGNLVLAVAGGEIVQKPPVSYQTGASGLTSVRGRFVVRGDCEVGFALDGYDRSLPLVIDPVLSYSTYLGAAGGNGDDDASAIAVDSAGNAYVTGTSGSADFPSASPLQSVLAGPYDAFVTKLNPTGSALLYSTYLGGSHIDFGYGIAVDGGGNAYVAGNTESTDFPTANPFQPAHAGGMTDAFVAKLDPTGSALLYATYLGGGNFDWASGLTVDSGGNAYATGFTDSVNFPTANPFQSALSGEDDAFVTKLSPTGSALVYSTYLGGSFDEYLEGRGIAVDAGGNAYITGETESADFPTANPLQPALGGSFTDAFVTKLNPAGSALVYSTYLGGSRSDGGGGIAVDAGENAYVGGETTSPDFPTVNPLQAALRGGTDAFVAKLNSTGSALVYSTYLGGSDYSEAIFAIAVDTAGNAHVTGHTSSIDFPTVNPLQPAIAGGLDAFVTKLNPAGSALLYSTYLGGGDPEGGAGIAVDTAGNAYVVGVTESIDFPTANPLQSTNGGKGDAYVAKLDPTGSALLYSTYLGGMNGEEFASGIAVDAPGNAYLTGRTEAPAFPTVNPLQSALAGKTDAFVTKLNPTGSALLYSTFFGGSDVDFVRKIAVDSAGNAYITGYTLSTDFPTANPLQAANAGLRDAFAAKLNSTGSSLVYSTYLGGSDSESGNDIAVDTTGNAYLVGDTTSSDFPTANALQSGIAGSPDAFVTKLNPTGSALLYSTYLGGSSFNRGDAIAVDGAGNAYVAGETFSSDFPIVNPLQPAKGGNTDTFVAKLNPAGSALLYSTYLGGANADYLIGGGIAVDGAGNAYVAGVTQSVDFPTVNPLQPVYEGYSDAFVAKLNPSGSALLYSTYLGGSLYDSTGDIAVDGGGNAYVTGQSESTDFPTLSPLQPHAGGSSDAFVTKLNPAGSALVYSTYLGGSGPDSGSEIAVDASGSAYITGLTWSLDFPTRGGIRSTSAGGPDAFLAKLSECASAPGRVANLMVNKVLPSDTLLSWEPEPSSTGGYHVYAVDTKTLLPTANLSSNRVCNAPAGQIFCTHSGGLPAPPTATFYQVVGVCSDGLSEGPM